MSPFVTDLSENQVPYSAIIGRLPFPSAYANEITVSMNVGGVWFRFWLKLFVTPDCSFSEKNDSNEKNANVDRDKMTLSYHLRR